MEWIRTARAALFVFVGAAFLAHWLLSDPSYDSVRSGWSYVLGFSGVLFLLAVALPVFGRMVGGGWVVRFSGAAAASIALGSVANVVEDGLEREWAFWGFVVSLAILDLALLAMVIAIGLSRRGLDGLLALVPAGTLAAVIFYVPAGGALMLATWAAAAGMALVVPSSRAALATSRA